MKKLLLLAAVLAAVFTAAVLAAVWFVFSVSPMARQKTLKADLMARPRQVLVVQAGDGVDRVLERAGLLKDDRVSLWTLRAVFRETNPGVKPGALHPGDRVKLPLAEN